MGTPVNWRYIDNAEDWMRQSEKHAMHQARRPNPSTAAALMGPGLGPNAIEITDWNAPETQFNGMFISMEGALHTPNSTLIWLGLVLASGTGHAIQLLWSHPDPPAVPVHYLRSAHTHAGATTTYSSWTLG